MTMNFFEHQERARRSTGRLVIMFSLAVVGIIAVLYFFFALLLAGDSHPRGSLWQPMTLLWVMGGTLLTSGLACLIKISSLSAGGSAVAEMVGGVKVAGGTGDLAEQKYVNVVEEMAIASGVPVPDIYILQDERSINAFAAGYSIDDAAVAVSRGCIERLDRDELQGVVAHEFSHILNGDMRLNIRLIGVLAGILFIASAGEFILRYSGNSSSSRRRSSSSKDDGGGGGIILVGLALLLIGYVGYLFGSLIKAAVSRQREFLADASAVQFTRLPDGIGGALRKIGGYADGKLDSPKASEVSHMCFTSVSRSLFSFKTHPPLPERISRIENLPIEGLGPAAAATAAAAPLAAGVAGLAGTAGEGKIEARPEDVVASTGTVSSDGIRKAAKIVARLPSQLLEAAQHPYSATLLACLLLLPDEKRERRKMVRKGLSGILEKNDLAEMLRIEKFMGDLDPHARLPLLEMAAPALRMLTKSQEKDFLKRIDEIIKLDTRIDLREFCYATIIDFCLHGGGKLRGRNRKRYRKIKELAPDFSRVLSVLSDAGQDDSRNRQRAFTAARKKLDGKVKLKYEAGGVEMAELRR
ncbi:MAG: M48 family metallopeptidase, partial [Planctomycetes bacterium]|nr:M48 family metallopeptidase [Planctomycetota bacterium]